MGSRGGRQILGSLLATCLFGVSWLGCSEDKTSEVVPGVITQIQIPKNLRTVRIDTQAQGEPASCIIHSVDPNDHGFIRLPSTLGVVPGRDVNRPVTVTVTGYEAPEGTIEALRDCATPPTQGGTYAPGVKLLRRARLTYVNGRIVFVPMSLRYSCWEANQCAEGQTCIAGECTDATIDASQLSDFNPALIDPSSSVCFNAEQCLADQAPAQLVDADTCTYTFASPPPGSGVNVRVYYDDGESEILDVDPSNTPPNLQEGYTVLEGSPLRFRLAPGLCKLVKAASPSGRRIIAVDAASICPSKTVLQPICAGRGVSAELAPAVSALYILMDNSKSTAPLFGADKVKTVLDLSLDDPAFRTTSVAFGVIPHTGDSCTAGVHPAATPLVPFGPAPTVREAVGAFVADTNNVLPDDSNMNVDGLLRQNGAYEAVRSFVAGKGAFNRLGVLLLLNRSPDNDCGGLDMAAQAEKALADHGIYTYVVMLNNDDGGPQDTAKAAELAQKGGTTLFDAQTDPTVQGPEAFNAIVHDFGSCVYENTAHIDTSGEVFFVNPLAGNQRVPVPYDAACKDGTGNGWAIDDLGRVRLCGQSCADLRNVLTAASLAKPNAPPHVGVYGVMN